MRPKQSFQPTYGSLLRSSPATTKLHVSHEGSIVRKLIAILSLGLITSCAIGEGAEYTLYRTGIDVPTQKHDETLRIHVATFDALPLENVEDNAKYNLANCEFAQEMFTLNQPHFRNYRSNTVASGTIKIKYWCEKGRFKK